MDNDKEEKEQIVEKGNTKETLLNKLYICRGSYLNYLFNKQLENVVVQKEEEINNTISDLKKEKKIESRKSNVTHNFSFKIFFEENWVLFTIVPAISLLVLIFAGIGRDNFFLRILFWLYIMLFLVAIFAVSNLICLVITLITHNILNKQKKYSMANQYALYNAKKENEKKRVEDLVNQNVPALKNEISELDKFKESVIENKNSWMEAFQHITNLTVYKSYTNIEAVCQFIQYLESGRCDALEGVHGCYNLYESEKRQDLIIFGLENVNYNLVNFKNEVLSQLQENQTVLYNALKEVENTTLQAKNDIMKGINEGTLSIRKTIESEGKKSRVVSALEAASNYSAIKSVASAVKDLKLKL